MSATSAIHRRGRHVTVVNGVVTLAVIGIVAAVALVVKPPAPPGIAEFAPQASKPITKAPLQQAGRFGGAGGGCRTGLTCSGRTALPGGQSAVVALPQGGVPSALQCFSWPDGAVTQTFDPQSPPCIATWPGAKQGNGGATAPGVTDTEIRIAFPRNSSDSEFAYLTPIVNFFNTHFELYGRHLVLVPYTSAEAAEAENNYDANPTDERADASQALALHVFASTDFIDPFPGAAALPAYLDTLADHHIITVAGGDVPPSVSASAMLARAPYEWSYEPSTSQLLANVAAMTCKQLAGKPAIHAADYRTTKRKFAVVLPDTAYTGGELAGLHEFLKTLGACGVPSPPVVYYDPESPQDGTTGSAFSESMLQLKQAGVTSLFFYPYWFPEYPNAPQPVAEKINYSPEWIAVGWYSLPTAELSTGGTQELANTFGVADWNKMLLLQDLPWHEAYLAAGGNTTYGSELLAGEALYQELSVLASGAQMAGPRLTPTTFGRALRQTEFPNPGAAAAPSYQATVGFSHEPSMVDDYAEFWIAPNANGAKALDEHNNSANDTYDQFCYVQLGRRWNESNWPRTDQFRQGGCR